MSEIAVRDTTDIQQHRQPVEPMLPQAPGTMRLVQWAEETQAASHLARALCRTPFAGSWKGDEDGATACILKGSEVGLTPVTALGAFDNIQGTPAPKAITLRALVQSHGHDLEIIEETDQRAVARYRRHGKGEWLTTEFTVEHARAMKLLGKDNWQKQLGAMLVARVTSKAARLVASDVILGIGYSAEEIRDSDDWDDRPRRANQPAATASAAERMGAVLGTAAEHVPETTAAEPGLDEPAVTPAQLKKIGAAMSNLGITDRANALLYVSDVVGRDVDSRSDLSKAEATALIDALEDEISKGDQGGAA